MRIFASALFAIFVLVLDEAVIVSCEDNATMANATITIAPSEQATIAVTTEETVLVTLPLDTESPSGTLVDDTKTNAPSEKATMAVTAAETELTTELGDATTIPVDTAANETEVPTLGETDPPVDETDAPTIGETDPPVDETDAPTIGETPAATAEPEVPEAPEATVVPTEDLPTATEAPTLRGTTALTAINSEAPIEIQIEVDEEASNTTDLGDLAQEPVGNITLEIDETPVPIGTAPPIATEAPTESPTEQEANVTATEAPAEVAATSPPETAPPDASPPPTSAPVEVTAATQPPVSLPDVETDTTTCAVQVSNTDPVCAQLLKFTTAVCDCYNFCSGRLIACLEYGERNSFSCSGETVAGCTSDQKITSAATPQRMMTSLAAVLAAAIPALVVL